MMNTKPLYQFSVATVFLVALVGTTAQVVAQEESAASLFELDYRGGYGRQRVSDEPYLSVHTDGRVFRTLERDQEPVEQCQLSAEELLELTDFVLVEHRLGEVDPQWLQSTLEAAKEARKNNGMPRPAIADLPTTVLRLFVDSGTVELASRGLARDVRQFPQITELASMAAVMERLQELCGGPPE